MRDRGPSILLRPGGDSKRVLRVYDPNQGAHYYIYVDNLGVLSSDLDDARSKLDGIIRVLESFGLVVHETEISSGKIQTLGVELDCEQLVTRVVQARRCELPSGASAAGAPSQVTCSRSSLAIAPFVGS